MILDLSISADQNRARVYLDKLIKDGSPVELKKIHKNRTNRQNRYMHALFALFGSEVGYNIEETKVVVKRALGYTYKKSDQMFLKHTSEMDVKELSEFIDKFRTWSSINFRIYLPSTDEFDVNYIEIMKQISHYERW